MSRDVAGRRALNAVFGDRITASRCPDVLVQFQYGISTEQVGSALTGDGSATATKAVATLSAGSASTGSATLTSKDVVRYQPGHDGYALFTAAFSAADGGSYQRIGLFDSNNGFWIGQVDGQFGVGVRYDGVDTFRAVAPDLYNSIAFDPTKLWIYRISYGWLGIAPDYFEVFSGATSGWQRVYIYDRTGLDEVPTTVQPVQPVRAECGRTTGSGEVTLKSCSWSAGRVGTEGDTLASDRHGASDNTKSITADTETNILTLRNKSTFQGQTNRVLVHLDHYSVSAEGTKPAVFRLRRNATLGGTPSYSDVDAANSVIEVDTAGTTVSGGVSELPIAVGKAGQARGYIRDLVITLAPGETMTLSAESTGSSEVLGAVRWHEEF